MRAISYRPSDTTAMTGPSDSQKVMWCFPISSRESLLAVPQSESDAFHSPTNLSGTAERRSATGACEETRSNGTIAKERIRYRLVVVRTSNVRFGSEADISTAGSEAPALLRAPDQLPHFPETHGWKGPHSAAPVLFPVPGERKSTLARAQVLARLMGPQGFEPWTY